MTRAADRLRAAAVLLAATLNVAAIPASAQSSDADALRPTGPVTLTADRGEWVENGEMVYEGNVTLQSDTLKLAGASMIVTQLADGHFEAQIRGTPARLDHAGRPGANGVAAQNVTAEAERIDYDSRRGVIQLNSKARLLRGGDEVTGEQIDYIVAERRVRASGGSGGQVRIVIQPPQQNDGAAPPVPTATAAPTPPPATPTPAPTPAAATATP